MCPRMNWYQCQLILPGQTLLAVGTSAWHRQFALSQSVLQRLPGVDPNNEAIQMPWAPWPLKATKDDKTDKKQEDKK